MKHEAGTVVGGRYEILALIGLGGMGAVYKVKDQETDLIMALKQMNVPQGGNQQYYEKRFREEMRLLEALDHPAIPKVTDHFVGEQARYLVMEFIEGPSLGRCLEFYNSKNQKFPEKHLVDYAIQMCEVLDYLHGRSQPLIHRDIKPDNIIVRKGSDRIVLVDFGIARGMDEESTKTMVGTMGYAPLEQVRGHPEPRSDLYALGVTLHHLLSGVPPQPFQLPPLQQVAPHAHESLVEVVNRATQSQAANRYMSAGHMRKALKEAKSRIDPDAAPAPVPQTAHKHREFKQLMDETQKKSHYAFFTIALLVGVLVSLGTLFFVRDLQTEMEIEQNKVRPPEVMIKYRPAPDPSGQPDEVATHSGRPHLKLLAVEERQAEHLSDWFARDPGQWRFAYQQNVDGDRLRCRPEQTGAVVFTNAEAPELVRVRMRLERSDHCNVVIQLGEVGIEQAYDPSREVYVTSLMNRQQRYSEPLHVSDELVSPLLTIEFRNNAAYLTAEGTNGRVEMPGVEAKIEKIGLLMVPPVSECTLKARDILVEKAEL